MKVITVVHDLQKGKQGVKLFVPGNKRQEETALCCSGPSTVSHFLMEQEILLGRPQL